MTLKKIENGYLITYAGRKTASGAVNLSLQTNIYCASWSEVMKVLAELDFVFDGREI